MNRLNQIACLSLAASTLALASCGRSDDASAGAKAPPAEPSGMPAMGIVRLPEGLIVSVKEPSGTHVAACKAAAKQGEEVTIVGRIGGTRNPFVADAAVFTIVDPSLKACGDSDDDHCKTPWDYCCEDREAMKRSMATVEVVGDDGQPLALPLRGLQGLEPLAMVAVTGTVTERNDQGVFVVRARKIAVR